MCTPFSPIWGSAKTISCTTSTQTVTLPDEECETLRINTLGSNAAYLRLGTDSSITANSTHLTLLGNTSIIIPKGKNTHIAAVASASTCYVQLIAGYGGC